MNTAVVIALLAVAISLGAAFTAAQAGKAKKLHKRDGSDSSATASSDSSGADCSPGDGGGCDGGGGGGD
jgi:uncharacterized membrane protein